MRAISWQDRLGRCSCHSASSHIKRQEAALEIESWVAESFRELPLAAREDLPTLGLGFKIPVVFIEDTNDAVNPMIDAEDYFNRLTAPKKDFVRIAGGTHFVLFEEPASFLTAMLTHVRHLLSH